MTTVDWLLDADPAIRWQVIRDLMHDAEGAEVERSRVANEGWGAELLALQGPDGQWDGGTYIPSWALESEEFIPAWTSTTYSLLLLKNLGADAANPRVSEAVALVRDNSRWEQGGQAYFDGEVEPCINGMALAIGSYFGHDVDTIVGKLLEQPLSDGGWNCWAEYGASVSSFNSTLTVLEGLLEYERAGGAIDVTDARARGEAYLLERHLLRRVSTGEPVSEDFKKFSYPTYWHFDALRALDYFRSANVRDERLADAVALVEAKRTDDGRWLLENSHEGKVPIEMEDGDGNPSRWNTLRALRVLDWWAGDAQVA
jgi:hypothetical protein